METLSLIEFAVMALLSATLITWLIKEFRENDFIQITCQKQMVVSAILALGSLAGLMGTFLLQSFELLPALTLPLMSLLGLLFFIAILLMVVILILQHALPTLKRLWNTPSFIRLNKRAKEILAAGKKGLVSPLELLKWLEELTADLEWLIDGANKYQLDEFFNKKFPDVVGEKLESMLKQLEEQVNKSNLSKKEKLELQKQIGLFNGKIGPALSNAINEIVKDLKEYQKKKGALRKRAVQIGILIKKLESLKARVDKLTKQGTNRSDGD